MPTINYKQFLFRMSLLWRGPWLGGQLTLVGGPGLRDECGGVEAADQQPLGLEGQIGVLCAALQVHVTSQVPHGGGGKGGPHQEYD